MLFHILLTAAVDIICVVLYPSSGLIMNVLPCL